MASCVRNVRAQNCQHLVIENVGDAFLGHGVLSYLKFNLLNNVSLAVNDKSMLANHNYVQCYSNNSNSNTSTNTYVL